LNGIRSTLEAAFPDARRLTVENLDTGEGYTIEATERAFRVPAGRYRYAFTLKPAVACKMRAVISGKAAATLFHNGSEVFRRVAGAPYVPALHRSIGGRVDLDIGRGYHFFEILCENAEEGEVFIDFGTPFGCGEWITTNEFFAGKLGI
jgi:hypothetical protein